MARKALDDLGPIISNVAKWDENFVKYANDKGYNFTEILDLLKPGTASRAWLDKNAPSALVKKAETIVSMLAQKQSNAPRSTSGTKGRYRIIPTK